MKINGSSYRTIWPDQENHGTVNIIDQRLLPYEFVIEKLTTVDATVVAIRDMYVRGAGLIGAAYNVRINLKSIDDEAFRDEMRSELSGLVEEGESLAKEVEASMEEALQS